MKIIYIYPVIWSEIVIESIYKFKNFFYIFGPWLACNNIFFHEFSNFFHFFNWEKKRCIFLSEIPLIIQTYTSNYQSRAPQTYISFTVPNKQKFCCSTSSCQIVYCQPWLFSLSLIRVQIQPKLLSATLLNHISNLTISCHFHC